MLVIVVSAWNLDHFLDSCERAFNRHSRLTLCTQTRDSFVEFAKGNEGLKGLSVAVVEKMESWIKISLFLCMFGFLKEFRPSEPFIVDFLLGDRINLTDEVINQELFPIGTYCNCVWLVLVLLVTDLLRYKPIIILEAIGGIGCWALLVLVLRRNPELCVDTNVVNGKGELCHSIRLQPTYELLDPTRFLHVLAYMLSAVQTILEICQRKMVEVLYGLFMATEVAYFTYMYALVDKEHYQQVTSHTRTAYLLGRSISGVLAQLFMSIKIMDSHQLNYLTLGSLCLATVWAVLLPPAKENIYFQRISQNSGNEVSSEAKHRAQQQTNAEMVVSTQTLSSDMNTMTYCQKCSKIYTLLWKDFVAAFTNWYVVKWSIWWALATCGYLQITTYVQLLYETILEENKQEDNELYNGAVEAITTLLVLTVLEHSSHAFAFHIYSSPMASLVLTDSSQLTSDRQHLGACATLACSWLKIDWRTNGETALALCSLIEAAVLFVSSQSQVMWLAYLCYVIFVVVYYAMFTITNAEVAKNIHEDSYGLIFGANTLFSLLLQTVLTLIVMSGNGLALASRQQLITSKGSFLRTVLLIPSSPGALFNLRAANAHDIYVASMDSGSSKVLYKTTPITLDTCAIFTESDGSSVDNIPVFSDQLENSMDFLALVGLVYWSLEIFQAFLSQFFS
uniref:Reduced folate carrier n=1 Tax=Timema monikensis TaxID=170555 RepID=A0A7R9EB44_9NEOP|nr:unnamed protein product [Timema monikensis]